MSAMNCARRSTPSSVFPKSSAIRTSRRKDPARQREYANIINASGQHLLGLVNTILDMSKIESGHFEIEPSLSISRGLIDFCCDVVKLKAEAKNIAPEPRLFAPA